PIGIYSKDRTAVIYESLKRDDLRHQIQIDSHAIRSYDRFDFERNPSISRFKSLRSGRRHNGNVNRSGSATSARDTGNLRRGERRWITKFSDNFDDGALPALGGHFRCGKKIDPFFLVERANNDLELRIGKNTG